MYQFSIMIGYKIVCGSVFLVLFQSILCQDALTARYITDDYVTPTSPVYENRKGQMVQYRPGDILIGGMLRVHTRGSGDVCASVTEDGIQSVETVNMVIDMINANATFLPGIKLGTVIVDTCDIDTHALQRAVSTFLPYFWNTNSNNASSHTLFPAVVGAASSAVSIQTASLLQIFEIPQVSPWSTHPDLSNKGRFPYFFRTVPSDAYQAYAIVKLVAERRWNYISVVYEDDLYGIRGYREVEAAASSRGMCIAVALAIPRNPTPKDFSKIVKDLLNVKKAKAVVVFTKRYDAENLISAAHNNSESRRYFLWIGSDGWTGQIPTGKISFDYLDTLDGAIGFSPATNTIQSLKVYMENLTFGQHLSHNGKLNPRNPWFPEYLSKLRLHCRINDSQSETSISERICQANDRLNKTTFFTLSKMQNVADAVLAIASSLQKYIKEACGVNSGLCSSITANKERGKLSREVYKYMKTNSFQGINGENIYFDKHQDGPAVYTLQLFQKSFSSGRIAANKWQKVGLFQADQISWNSNDIDFSNVTSVCSKPCLEGHAKRIDASTCCWQCQACSSQQYVGINGTQCIDCARDEKPTLSRDGCMLIPITYARYSDTYSIASMLLAIIGFFMTLFVVTVFCVHRETPIVKASGRELCAFVFTGAILCLMNSFILASQPTTILCATSRILLSFGPTMMYAGLLTKTLRVIIIFQSKAVLSSPVKLFLLPKYQLMTVLIITSLQVVIVAAWCSLSSPEPLNLYPVPGQVFLACRDAHDLLVLVGLAYPFVLIIICTILATVNRKVPTGFNETQYIGFTMYATCVIWLSFLPVFITNSTIISLKLATMSICSSLSAITVLACLFGFRCYVILFSPEANTSKSVMSTVNQRNPSEITTHSNVINRNEHKFESGVKETVNV